MLTASGFLFVLKQGEPYPQATPRKHCLMLAVNWPFSDGLAKGKGKGQELPLLVFFIGFSRCLLQYYPQHKSSTE